MSDRWAYICKLLATPAETARDQAERLATWPAAVRTHAIPDDPLGISPEGRAKLARLRREAAASRRTSATAAGASKVTA